MQFRTSSYFLVIISVFLAFIIWLPNANAKKLTKPTERAVYHNNQGVSFLNRNQFDQAVFEFKTAIELSPEYVEAYNNLGVVYKIQGKLDLAKQEFEKAIKLDKKYAAAYSHLGAVLLAQGNIDGSIEANKKGLKQDSTIADIHYNLALAYIDKWHQAKDSKYADLAEKELVVATELNSNMLHAHIMLARVYHDRGDYEKAIIRYRLALGNDPSNVEIWRALGEAYLAKGDQYEAQNCFQKALEMQPESQGNHIDLGLFYLKEGKYDQAVTEFKAAIALEPAKFEGWYHLGTAWLLRAEAPGSKKGEAAPYYAEATKALQKALELNPNSGDARYNLGLVYYKTGRTAQAQAEWETAVNADPKNARAAYNLGLLYRQLGREDDGLNMFCKFLKASGGGFANEEAQARQAIEARGFKCPK